MRIEILVSKAAQRIARIRWRELINGFFPLLTSMRPLLKRDITPALFMFGLAMVVFVAATQSKAAFIGLIAFIPLAWVAIFLLAVERPEEKRSVHSLLKIFRYQVDLAHQQLNRDPKTVDQNVLKAFDKLHTQVKVLLQKKKIRLARLRQEVMEFPYPPSPRDERWRGPSLSEMGYALGVSETFSPDSPVLALYKFSGEEQQGDGAVVDMFTIMAAGSPPSPLFSAKLYSPNPNYVVATEAVHAAAAASATPPVALTETAAVRADADAGVGYALSLLGPITLSNVRALEQNLHAMTLLLANSTRAEGMPAATVRQNLRDLLTEKMGRADALLPVAIRAVRQEPRLLVCALADASRDGEDNPAKLHAALDTLAEILLPSAPASRPGLVTLMTDMVLLVQSLGVIPADTKLLNPGLAYVEARGAETDSAFLRRVAQLVLSSTYGANEQPKMVMMSTNLSEQEFRAQLRSYSELAPGKENQQVLDTLLVGLNVKRLMLNIVSGNVSVTVKDIPNFPRDKPIPYLLLSANPALLDVEGLAPPHQHVLWTLNGRALEANSDKLDALYFDQWYQAIRHPDIKRVA